MSPENLPSPASQPNHGRSFRRLRVSLRAHGPIRTGLFVLSTIVISLIVFASFLSPTDSLWRRPSDWYGLLQKGPFVSNPKYPYPPTPPHAPTPAIPTGASRPSPSPSPSPPSDILTLEQIRDIVTPTKGFFSRDFSLGLGWNNMRYILDAAVLQAELLNRTLVVPSFVYARACEYNITVCADYATMVNKNDAIGWEEWRKLPYEQQMGFRIPISIMLDLPLLRQKYPVITASEYLRLHGQDPESESSSGFWPREQYIARPNVFQSNKTRTPTQFIIENHWYDPSGTHRVDYIPQEMKDRGKWGRHPGTKIGETAGSFAPEEPTDVSNRLTSALPDGKFIMDWDTAKTALRAAGLGTEVDLNNDDVVERTLNIHGWEVLRSFQSVIGMDYAKTIVNPINEVVHRSTIRGFKDDYHHVDADVVILAGETHLFRKPGAMRFTVESSRAKYASMVVHSLGSPPKVTALAKVLAARIRKINGGRLWMGAHMRRGDFARLGWVMEQNPEAHIRRVKDRLQAGRTVLARLSNLATYDVEGAKPDMEQLKLHPPLPDDKFFVATDERDPEALRVISEAGAIFLSELLTIEDRRSFGWPLMITDVRALVEQALLVRSAFFYGHGMSSLSGVIINMRAARGADPRTMLLD
ncbi:hypothetical protein F5148DRAFT_1162781 [Russula earlei]|uniref:Uncharacterized protein n=1 Tax=Russula earlei TaxID=71964 RepID=A0ACC0UNE7_9AGAM|nr:hypothetical protein F5148DRAFT_1162781 [Russula earlei]